MIDLAKLEPVLGGYQTYFPKHWPHVEDFKWEAAQHFHDHWNIDAADFGEMFKEATAKVFSLLDTGYAYPRAMILNFAAADCEATRAMFRSLFDESTELSQRIIAFQASEFASEFLRTFHIGYLFEELVGSIEIFEFQVCQLGTVTYLVDPVDSLLRAQTFLPRNSVPWQKTVLLLFGGLPLP